MKNTPVLYWAIINVILKACDVISTTYAVKMWSSDIESNPIVQSSINICGLWTTMAIIFTIQAGLVWLLYHFKRVDLLKVVAALMGFVVTVNMLTIIMQSQ